MSRVPAQARTAPGGKNHGRGGGGAGPIARGASCALFMDPVDMATEIRCPPTLSMRGVIIPLLNAAALRGAVVRHRDTPNDVASLHNFALFCALGKSESCMNCVPTVRNGSQLFAMYVIYIGKKVRLWGATIYNNFPNSS